MIRENLGIDLRIMSPVAQTIRDMRVMRNYSLRVVLPQTFAYKLAEARVSRTHRRPLGTTAGFEDREDHRSLSTSL